MVVSSSFRSYSSGDSGSSKVGRRPTSVDREVRFSKSGHDYNGTSSAPHIGQIKILRSSDEEGIGGSRGRYSKRADSDRGTVYNVTYGSSKPYGSSLYRSSSVDRWNGGPVGGRHTPMIDPRQYKAALQPIAFTGGYAHDYNTNAYVPERTSATNAYAPERTSAYNAYVPERTSARKAYTTEHTSTHNSYPATRKSYVSLSTPMSYATYATPVDTLSYSSPSRRSKRLPSPEIGASSYSVKRTTESNYAPHYGGYSHRDPDSLTAGQSTTRVYSSSVPYRRTYSNEAAYAPYISRYQPGGTTRVTVEESNLYNPLPKYSPYATPVWENYDSKAKRSYPPHHYGSNLDLSTQVELLKRSHSLPKLNPLTLPDTHSTFTHKGYPYHNLSGIISYRPVTDRAVEKHVHKSDAIDIEQKIKDIRRSAAIDNARARKPSDLDDLFKWKPYEYKPHSTYDLKYSDVPLDSYTLKTNTSVPVFRYVNSTPSHIGSYPEVLTTTLPDGRRGLQYTTSSQTGYGNQNEANREIDNIVRKTKGLEDNLNALESFIAKNRHLFPDDILVYQFIKFYRLSPDELATMGERPDAEQYGAKTVEKLVVPYGCNARDVLRKYYPRHSEIEVEFDDADRIRHRGTAPPNIPEPLRHETSTRQKRYTYETEEFNQKKPDRRRPNIEVDDFEYRRPTKRGDSVPAFYDSDPYVPRIKEASHRDLIVEARGGHARAENKYATRREEETPARGGPAPEFTSKLRPRRVTPGTTVRLSCAVSSVPEATVQWFKMDAPVLSDPRHNISYYHGLCSLEIHDVKPSDAGVYVVKATNPRGSTTCSAPLEIDGEEGPQFPGAPSLGKPIFISHLENVSADTGDRIIFKGVVLCKPVPDSVVWLKDGIEILENEKYRMYSDDDGNVKLSVRDVKPNDIGLYTSIVKNNFGTTKSVASLKLRDVPDHPDLTRRPLEQPQRQEGSDKKPVFVVLPAATVKAYEGEPLTLKCVAQGEPKPKVRWFRGVREMSQSPRHNITSEKDGTNTFQINSIMMQTDGGTYEVEATNIFGTTTATVMVVVEPRRENEDFDFEPQKEIPFDSTPQKPKESTKPQEPDDSLESLIEKITLSTDAPAPIPTDENPEEKQPVVEEIEVPKNACALGRDGSPSALKLLDEKERGVARPADESKMNIPAQSTMEDILADLKDVKPIDEEAVPEEAKPVEEQKSKEEVKDEVKPVEAVPKEKISVKKPVQEKSPEKSVEEPFSAQENKPNDEPSKPTTKPEEPKNFEESVTKIEAPIANAEKPETLNEIRNKSEEPVDVQEPVAKKEAPITNAEKLDRTPAPSEDPINVEKPVAKKEKPVVTVEKPQEPAKPETDTPEKFPKQEAELTPTKTIEDEPTKPQDDNKSVKVEPKEEIVKEIVKEPEQETKAEPIKELEKEPTKELPKEPVKETVVEAVKEPTIEAVKEPEKIPAEEPVKKEPFKKEPVKEVKAEKAKSATTSESEAASESEESSSEEESSEEDEPKKPVEAKEKPKDLVEKVEEKPSEKVPEVKSEKAPEAVPDPAPTEKAPIVATTAECGEEPVTVKKTEVTATTANEQKTEEVVEESTEESEIIKKKKTTKSLTEQITNEVTTDEILEESTVDELETVTKKKVKKTVNETDQTEQTDKLQKEVIEEVLEVKKETPTKTEAVIKEIEQITKAVTEEKKIEVESEEEEEESDEETGSRPSFEVPVKSQIVQFGTTATFECTVAGDPEPTVEWLRGDKVLVTEGKIRVVKEGKKHKLHIDEVDFTFNDQYAVRATNKRGRSQYKAKLLVKGTAPSFFEPIKSVVVPVGTPAKFICKLAGNPMPTAVWQKDGVDLQPSDRFIITSEGDIFSFEIVKPTLEDKGQYSIIASNNFGRSTFSATLVVHEVGEEIEIVVASDETKKTVTVTENEAITNETVLKAASENKTEATVTEKKEGATTEEESEDEEEESDDEPGVAPGFEAPVKSQAVSIHTTATFECIVKGDPEPTVKWMKGDKVLTTVDKIKISNEGRKHSLVIDDVTFDDNGQYVAVASNKVGRCKCTATMLVKGIAPRFEEPLKSVVSPVGSNANFDCKITGLPDPKITWIKDDVELKFSDRIQSQKIGNKYTLTFTPTEDSDNGQYTLIAANDFGRATFTATLVVHEIGAEVDIVVVKSGEQKTSELANKTKATSEVTKVNEQTTASTAETQSVEEKLVQEKVKMQTTENIPEQKITETPKETKAGKSGGESSDVSSEEESTSEEESEDEEIKKKKVPTATLR